MAFTATDIPHWTLPSVMTDTPAERNQIFSISTIASSLAAGVGAVVVPLIYGALGKEEGFLVAAIVFASIAIVCYYVAGLNVRERIKPTPFHKGIGASLKSVVTNKPLLIIMGASLLANFAFQLKVAVNAYYGEYTLGKVGYVTWLSGMLLLGMLIGSALVPLLLKKFGSKNATLIALGAGAAVSLGYWACGYSNVIIVLVWSALCAMVIGAFSVLLNVLTADAMDYAEIKKGERNEAIITSTRTFITKLATAIAGALVGYLLGPIGYAKGQVQSVYVNDVFHRLMSLYPSAIYLAAFIVMLFYPLSKSAFEAMEVELRQKKADSSKL
jgi:GPH family glycoside/pentoside/hexuronide:cation symporter